MEMIANNRHAVLDSALEQALHLTDLIPLFCGAARLRRFLLSLETRLRRFPRRLRGCRQRAGGDDACDNDDCVPFHKVPLLSLRCTIQQVKRLPLFHDFHAEIVPHQTQRVIDVPEIGLPLRVHIPHDFGNPESELALLALFAFVQQDAYATQCLRV
jgi:hypothetical protein